MLDIRINNKISELEENMYNRNKSHNIQKSRLPPRWLYCPPVGKIVAKKFLPTKTPLDNSYDHLIESPQYHFHPENIFHLPLIGAHPGAKIGLWIDLTNSDYFYNGEEVRKKGCRFVKMKMVGHAQSPTEEQISKFIQLVDDFTQENPDDIILVHCTHGFNRTGFLISAYLFEKEGLSIEMAVREFAECRPKGIYKQDYLDDLRKLYGDEDDELTSPGRPNWEEGPISDEEFTNDGAFVLEANIEENGKIDRKETSNGKADRHVTSSSSSSTSATNLNAKNMPVFMDGKIPSAKFVEDPGLRKSVQEKARKFCGYGSKGFPGSQPVSLEGEQGNKNIRFLATEPYMVSWKADGVRYLVLIDGKEQVYAFDRDNNPFLLANISFVRRQAQPQMAGKLQDSDFLKDTLVDAEMVIDRVKVENQVEENEIPRLLIYDLITFQGQDTKSFNFDKRFEMIDKELIRPRIDAFKVGRLNRDAEPMGIRRKDFWLIQSTYKLLQRGFLSCHEVDGLIFQPTKRPYTAGRFEYLLKWKPPELSTIDFKLQINKVHRTGELPSFVAELHVLHLDRPFAYMKPTKYLQQFNNKIIECKYSKETNTWEFMRERTDKSHPNALSTAESVCNTIKHPVNKHDLLTFIGNCAWKK